MRTDSIPSDLTGCPGLLTRRHFMTHYGLGIAGLALTHLLTRDNVLRAAPASGSALKPQFEPHAKRVIHIYLGGGLSQVDSFDYKLQLFARHGEPMPAPEKLDTFSGNVGLLHRPHWDFRP